MGDLDQTEQHAHRQKSEGTPVYGPPAREGCGVQMEELTGFCLSGEQAEFGADRDVGGRIPPSIPRAAVPAHRSFGGSSPGRVARVPSRCRCDASGRMRR